MATENGVLQMPGPLQPRHAGLSGGRKALNTAVEFPVDRLPDSIGRRATF